MIKVTRKDLKESLLYIKKSIWAFLKAHEEVGHTGSMDDIIRRNEILNRTLQEISRYGVNVTMARTWQKDISKQILEIKNFLFLLSTPEMKTKLQKVA